MSHQLIKGKSFKWHHISELDDADLEFLAKTFDFHPLDFDDLKTESELQKLDNYKDYIFCIFSIPTFNSQMMRVGKKNLSIFIGKDFVVTASRESILAVDRYFARAERSQGLRREIMQHSTGFFVYKLLDYVFRNSETVLKELVRETEIVESKMYEKHSKTTTKRLGILRRNVLFLRHIVDPQRILIEQFIHSRKSFLPKKLDLYFDDLHDSLDAIWVVTDNIKSIVDGLFEVNEALLSHRTNQIIRVLTIISVVLMPPTLIASYYGMNVSDLPFAENVEIVSLLIVLSLIVFWAIITVLDRRR